VESFNPVAWLCAETLASGMIAPDGSVTSPLMDPLPAWAKAVEANPINTEMMKKDRTNVARAQCLTMATPGGQTPYSNV
jgi:hypothetical protein